jgi:hypothetical protein
MAGLPQLVRASGGILATLAGLGGIAYTVNEAVYTGNSRILSQVPPSFVDVLRFFVLETMIDSRT